MRPVVITGCSGGGKSTLLKALAQDGFCTVPEPGRRIVRRAQAMGQGPLPWVDPAGFAEAAQQMAIRDFELSDELAEGTVFFDRGYIDAASALAHEQGAALDPGAVPLRYDPVVFFAPPWADLFASDSERRHGFETAVAESDRLARDYTALGYTKVDLPKVPVLERVDFIKKTLGL